MAPSNPAWAVTDITSVSPTAGPVAGGTPLTINGTDLAGALGVTVGNVACPVTGNTGTVITCTLPAGTSGSASDVEVTTADGPVTKVGAYTYVEEPTFNSLSIATGPQLGNVPVTVYGTFLDSATTISFGGANCTALNVVSPDEVSCTLPAGTPGAARDVVITSPGGIATGTGVLTYIATPTITTVAPTGGPLAGGDSLVITGTNFDGLTTVTVGGVDCPDVSVASATEVTCTLPTGTAGVKAVELTNPGGVATKAAAFTYADTPTITTGLPASGPADGSGSLTIGGTNLTDATITIDAVNCPVTGNTGTTVTCTPAGGVAGGAVDVVLTTFGGVVTESAAYTYADAPIFDSLSIISGPALGNIAVSVYGSNLGGTTSISFGGANCTDLNVVNTGQVDCTLPAGTPGAARNVVITTPGGTDTEAAAFTYIATPAITTVVPNAGPDDGGTEIAINGTNLDDATSVTIDSVDCPIGNISSIEVTCTTAGGSVGAKTIVLTNPGGVATKNTAFTYAADPTITTGLPARGPAIGGNSLLIGGTNLTGATITIDAVDCPVTANTGTTVTCTPAGGAAGAAVEVVITTPGGVANQAAAYSYADAPIYDSLSIYSGPALGNIAVSIYGTNLDNTSSISFGGVNCTGLNVVNTGQVDCTLPAGTAGAARDVVITTPGGIDTEAGVFTYIATPTITTVAPTGGPLAGGDSLVITGTNFDGLTTVTVGGIDCPDATVDSTTQVTCTLPTGTAGAKTVVLTNPGGVATKAAAYTYVAIPTITTVVPARGPADGSGSVTINGTNLTGATVTIGDDPCPITANIGTAITCTPAGGTAGVALDIQVTTLGGTADALAAYTYADAPIYDSLSIYSGPALGNIAVSIYGTNLDNTSSISFGGVNCTGLNVVNTGQVDCTLPAGTPGAARDVVITTPGGTDTEAGVFTYIATPTITTVAPTGGPLAGGDSLVITGTNFDGLTTVTVGGIDCPDATVDSTTQVTCTLPTGTAGAKTVVLTNPGGVATKAAAYTYAAIPTITTISPTSGPATGGGVLTVNGTALAGATEVKIGDLDCPVVGTTSTTITCTVPEGTVGPAQDIHITAPGGTADKAAAYTYTVVPVITLVSPASGPIAGNTTLTISGENLLGATAVTVGGTACTGVTVASDSEVTCTLPSGVAGARNVVITTPLGTDTEVGGYTYFALPTVTSVAPTSGVAAGGTALTITGTNLAGATAISVGGTNCPSLANVNATTVTCTSPAHAAGLVAVAVTTPGGTGTANSAYTYLEAPTVTSVVATSGPAAGGGTLVITGTGLTSTSAVSIGGTNCPIVANINSTTVSCTIPAHVAGVTAVNVTTPGGTASLPSAYTYVGLPTITSVGPTSGVAAGGGTLTITGTNLDNTSAITIGGTTCTGVANVSATSVTCTIPAHAAGVVAVGLTTPGGTASLPAAFTYEALPTVTSVGPTSGVAAGGGTLTITGTNLSGTTAISVGGTNCPDVANVNATTVTCTIPAHAAGVVAVSVTTPGGTANLPTAFTYNALPTVTSVGPTSGVAAGGGTLTITGTNLSGTTAVSVGGTNCPDLANVNATSVTCTIPAHAAGVVAVSVTTPGGTGNLPTAFTYTGLPTPPTITPTTTPPTVTPTTTPPTVTPTTVSPTPTVAPTTTSPTPSVSPTPSTSATPSVSPTPSTSPTPTTEPTSAPAVIKLDLNLSLNAPIVGSEAVLSGGGLRARSSYSLIMYSTPVRLAGGFADADGNFKTEVTLPSKVCVSGGLHRMVLTATAADGSALSDTSYIVMDGTCKTRSLRQVKPVNNTVTLGALLFPVGSTSLSARSKATVRGLKSSLGGAKLITVTSYSETKKKSAAAQRANKVVATKRAASVRTYLLSIGVKTKIVVVGVGGKRLTGTNRKYIRRAVITVRY